MAKKTATEVVGLIVTELTPLSSDERQRIIQASLALLGEDPVQPRKDSLGKEKDNEDAGQLPARARTWLKQNDVSLDQLGEVFHIDAEGIEVIAQIPGKSNRDRVRNAYVLLGIARLLSSGESKFDDKVAREFCEKSGFYDQTNHMKYMKGGNEFTGSKEKGWILTSPGLKRGAAIIKEITSAAQ